MIPFVARYTDTFKESIPNSPKIREFIGSAETWKTYWDRMYLYHCMLYGFNPIREVLQRNDRWQLFDCPVQKGKL